jgi:hypothetical protein
VVGTPAAVVVGGGSVVVGGGSVVVVGGGGSVVVVGGGGSVVVDGGVEPSVTVGGSVVVDVPLAGGAVEIRRVSPDGATLTVPAGTRSPDPTGACAVATCSTTVLPRRITFVIRPVGTSERTTS